MKDYKISIKAKQDFKNLITKKMYKKGVTYVIDITLEENWVWWIIGSTRCVKISGEAIK